MIVLLRESAQKTTFTSAPFNHTGRSLNDTTLVDYTITHNLGQRIKYMTVLDSTDRPVFDFWRSRNDQAGCGIRHSSWFMLSNDENSVTIRSARLSTSTISIKVYVEA